MLELLCLALLVGAALGLGSAVFRRFNIQTLPSETAVWHFGLGWALVGYLLMGLAALGLLRPSIVLPLLTILSIYGYAKYNGPLSVVRRSFRGVANTVGWEKVGWIVIGYVIASALIESYAPATTEDTLTYHFRIPLDYVRHGALIYSPFQPYNMPHLTEMVATISYLLGANDTGAQMLYLGYLVLLLISMFVAANEWANRRAAVLALVLFATTPMVTYIKVGGLVEVAMAATIMLALLAASRGLRPLDAITARHWLLISGAMCGIASGTKYYGLFSVIALGGLIFAVRAQQEGIRGAVRDLAIFATAATLFGFPFYLKNWIMTGNPLYPAFYGFFGGKDWSDSMSLASKAYFAHEKRLAGDTLIDFVLSPWRLTMDGERFLAGRSGYGFVYLAVAPLLLYWPLRYLRANGIRSVAPSASPLNFTGWFVVVLWFLWFIFAFHRGRHLLAAFMILSIISAAIVVPKLEAGARPIIRITLIAVLSIGILFQVAASMYFTSVVGRVALGIEPRESYLARLRPYWVDFQWMNEHLPERAKVLNLLGNYQLFLLRDQFYPSPYFQGWVDWSTIVDARAYRDQLLAAGFTHVVAQEYRGQPQADIFNSNDLSSRWLSINRRLVADFGQEIYSRDVLIPRSRSIPGDMSFRRISVFKLL